MSGAAQHGYGRQNWTGLEMPIDVSTLPRMAQDWHYGWSWKGPEPDCVCPKAPCGLVKTVNPRCSRHKPTYGAAKQLHKATECPA